MFVASRAYILSKLLRANFIEPTWTKFSIGPFWRHEKDKRSYFHIFNSYGISGWRKLVKIKKKTIHEKDISSQMMGIVRVEGLANYFQDLNMHSDWVKEYFDNITNKDIIRLVEKKDLKKAVAVHIRLGDYLPHQRVDIHWYRGVILNFQRIKTDQQFLVFSDGTNEELKTILDIPNVKRIFFGNAFADIYAISRCRFVIASDSTFSAWGAFLGQIPILFNRRHFPPVYCDDILEVVLGDSINIPDEFYSLLKQ